MAPQQPLVLQGNIPPLLAARLLLVWEPTADYLVVPIGLLLFEGWCPGFICGDGFFERRICEVSYFVPCCCSNFMAAMSTRLVHFSLWISNLYGYNMYVLHFTLVCLFRLFVAGEIGRNPFPTSHGTSGSTKKCTSRLQRATCETFVSNSYLHTCSTHSLLANAISSRPSRM